jgi:hypothetical protein
VKERPLEEMLVRTDLPPETGKYPFVNAATLCGLSATKTTTKSFWLTPSVID